MQTEPTTLTDADDDAALALRVQSLGRPLTPDLLKHSQALYKDRHPGEPHQGIHIHRDLAYGPDERHRLDVFQPQEQGVERPILLFVHGGGFVRGHKNNPGLPYFDNIGLWAARRGFLGITMTYRLGPQHPAPAGQQDVAAALGWIRENAATLGGDATCITVMGHSAGAMLVACHLAAIGADTGGIKGAILASGMYDFARLTEAQSVRNYFGEDYTSFSPITGLNHSPVPMLVAVGEHETRDFQDQALALVTALFGRDGTLPRFVRQSGQNHYTSCFRIGTRPGDAVEVEMESFIRETSGR